MAALNARLARQWPLGPGKGFRDELYPAYKAQRPPMPPELAAQLLGENDAGGSGREVGLRRVIQLEPRQRGQRQQDECGQDQRRQARAVEHPAGHSRARQPSMMPVLS